MPLVLQVLQRNQKFIILLALFIVGVLLHQSALPIMEGNDETIHYNYVVWLRLNNRLPDRATNETNTMRQASGQAPLMYWVAANVLNVLNIPHQYTDLWPDLASIRNRWFTPPNPWNRNDNYNQYYHGENERGFGHEEVVTADRIGRLLSLLYGVIAVIGAYGIAKEFFKRESWVITATAIFAFTPQMLYICAMLSNDIPATAFATLTIWQSMVLLRQSRAQALSVSTRFSTRRVLLIGLLLALAGLSKVSALAITPGIVLAILFSGRNSGASMRNTAVNFAAFALILAVLIGPWMWFGWTTFRDPFGLKPHENGSVAAQQLPPISQIIAELPETYMSYWGKFGSSSIWLSPLMYMLFTSIVLLSLLGFIVYVRRCGIRWRSLQGQQGVIALAILIPAFAALLYWLVTLFPIAFAITGRLIYFVHGIVAVMLTSGLYLLSKWLPPNWISVLRAYTLGVLMAAGLVIAPFVVRTAYAEPIHLSRAQLPTLKGGAVDFDHTLRFLGYSASTLTVQEGVPYTIKLCWEVLKPTTRDGAFSIKIFDDTSQIMGSRTSLLGMGHFSSILWQTGDIFCDNVEIPIDKPLKPAQINNVVLVMFDVWQDTPWEATDAHGNIVQYPLVTQVVSPAGDMSGSATNIAWQPTTVDFPDLARIKGYVVEGTFAPGQPVTLNLLWEATHSTTADWSEFVHLVGPTTSFPLGDSSPRANQYPTWAWSPGERIVETWSLTLPADLPAGDYSLQVGFSDRSTGQRIAVNQDGAPIGDKSAILGRLTIK